MGESKSALYTAIVCSCWECHQLSWQIIGSCYCTFPMTKANFTFITSKSFLVPITMARNLKMDTGLKLFPKSQQMHYTEAYYLHDHCSYIGVLKGLRVTSTNSLNSICKYNNHNSIWVLEVFMWKEQGLSVSKLQMKWFDLTFDFSSWQIWVDEWNKSAAIWRESVIYQ